MRVVVLLSAAAAATLFFIGKRPLAVFFLRQKQRGSEMLPLWSDEQVRLA